jgi:dipeptidyl aminopeptidase/acylaminoacyl peptidase
VTRRVSRARPAQTSSDGYALRPAGSLVAPTISLIGLLVVGLFTLGFFTGRLPFISSTGGNGGGGNGGGGGGAGDPNRTPTPSNVVIVDPRSDVPGSILYAKQGNLWLQSGTNATQITDTGRDSMPSWGPDGKWIYFIETVPGQGLFPNLGSPRHYTLTYPVLTRVHPDGSGRQALTDGLYKSGPAGAWQWFYWLRQPVLSPDGHTIALLSDGPDPTKSDVVLQFYDLLTKKLTRASVVEDPPLGHQDVAWRPDGKQLLYVRNSRDGSRGAPAIWTYDPVTRKSAALTGPGYTSPSFSPDGRYVAATRTSTFGTDVVILNARTGAELLRLTNDGQSWAPTWSPKGDAVAYLHIEFQIVDLRLVPLAGKAPSWTTGDVLDLTQYSGLDGSSRPSWFIPADQLPPPSPSPSAAASASGAASSGGSGASHRASSSP